MRLWRALPLIATLGTASAQGDKIQKVDIPEAGSIAHDGLRSTSGRIVEAGLTAIPLIFTDAAMKWGRRVGLLGSGNEWPAFTATGTYDPRPNATEINWVGHCLAQWCDTEEFLNENYGRIACRTSSERPGGGSVGFICNKKGKARCSRVQIAKTLHTLHRETGSATGYINLQTGPELEMTIGFDSFCEGGPCGDSRNPIWSACENPQDRHREALQWDREIDESDMYRIVGEDYLGVQWEGEQPAAPAPKAGRIDFPKVKEVSEDKEPTR